MTEKRFKIVDEQFISYYGGTGHKISNEECGFWLWHSKTESQKVCDKLNNILNEIEQLKQTVSDWSGSYDELFEDVKRLEKENEQIKQVIKEAIDNERTELGKSVLKQLLNNIGEI